MLKLKLQYFDLLMWKTDSFEKTLMLGKIEGRRRGGRQRIRQLDDITDSTDMSLLKLMSIESVMLSNHLILCHPLLLLPSICPSIRGFSKSQFFASRGQSIGASASASVLPMNTQDLSPLGWTGWISLQSKGLSKSLLQHHSSKASILQCSAFFIVQFTFIHDYWKNHSFD